MKLLPIALAAAAMTISGLAGAQAPADLLKAKNCLSCHDAEKKKVGPSLKDIAAKYKDNKEAEAKIVTALKEGKGHPVKVNATDAELKTMAAYVLSVK